MKMPWGKHKGEDLADLDAGYLRWIAEKVQNDMALVAEAENQLTMRAGRGVVRRGDGRTQILGDE